MANTMLANAYDEVDPKTAERLRNCATKLIYTVDIEGKRLLKSANFCRVRLCPVCQWRRALKTYGQLSQIVAAIENERPRSYALLTLTIKNCLPSELKETLDFMSESFNRMMGYKRIKTTVKGWYRGQEITHNTIEGTFHPHYHVLLCLNKTYWKKGYIKKEDWQAMWKRAIRADYDPQINIKRVKGDNPSVIAECCKYMCKPGDYIIPQDWELSVDTVRLLSEVLHKRRFSAMSGEIAYWHKRLHLEDAETGDLVHVDTTEAIHDQVNQYEVYCWRTGYSQYMAGDLFE